MPTTYQEELEDGIKDALVSIGYAPYRGIVRQVAPHNDPMVGDLLHGVAEVPFISISSILPENAIEGVGFASLQQWDRPVTVALIGNKKTVEADLEAFRLVRQRIMARLHINRFRGAFVSNPDSCIFKSLVRPRSQVNLAEWLGKTKYVSAFDVLFRTQEVTI
jgi:hypothetical protein